MNSAGVRVSFKLPGDLHWRLSKTLPGLREAMAWADALVKAKNCDCVAARIPLGRDGRCIEMWRPPVKERN